MGPALVGQGETTDYGSPGAGRWLSKEGQRPLGSPLFNGRDGLASAPPGHFDAGFVFPLVPTPAYSYGR